LKTHDTMLHLRKNQNINKEQRPLYYHE